MVKPDFLASRVLRARTPNDRAESTQGIINNPRSRQNTPSKTINSLFHLFRDFFVDSIAEVLNCTLSPTQDNRGRVVRRGFSWFGVDTDEIEVLPHSLDQLVDVEPFL